VKDAVDALRPRCAARWPTVALALLRELDEMTDNPEDLNRKDAKAAKPEDEI
jgi:hypothetical protein